MQGIIPPNILHALAQNSNPIVREAALRSIAKSSEKRAIRNLIRNLTPTLTPARLPNMHRYIYTAKNQQLSPGYLVLAEGDNYTQDNIINAAYDNSKIIFDFWVSLNRNSFDGYGSPMVTTVHYGEDYDNAFWDGRQIEGGDGDNIIFTPFFLVPDVIWHEWGHAITQYSSGLDYNDEPGALNESFSDAHGITVKQKVLNQTPSQADWLIGKGLFTDRINGVALRSMSAPGQAFDDIHLGGKDPQIAHYSQFTSNTEVHLGSGIPNKAFCDTARFREADAPGEGVWEKIFPVWYQTSMRVSHSCTFKQWAMTAIQVSIEMFPDTNIAKNIEEAWGGVGVL